jgi:hypothetical protein
VQIQDKLRASVAEFNKSIARMVGIQNKDTRPYLNRGLSHHFLRAYTGAIADYRAALTLSKGKHEQARKALARLGVKP